MIGNNDTAEKLSDVKVTFELIEKNNMRLMRDKGHAKFFVFEDGKKVDWLWMTNEDIKGNIDAFPDQKETLTQGFM
jgi:hypothetical protein